jgi:poly(A) polymerase
MGILKLIRRLIKKAPARHPELRNATIISQKQHHICKEHIHRTALKVLARLTENGYQAYLVGGSVRDLLLGKHPKDFDVATNARPEQIKRLFRNCRLIGRRFRLAHIYFQDHVIEVSTFRAAPTQKSLHQKRSQSGLIISDNDYGSIEQDAFRRDLTINALYYDMRDNSIIDFTQGLKDIKSKTIRMIGDPQTRYREDPVRMLRVIRFAAKLDMTLHPDTAAPIIKSSDLLKEISSARLFDEILKLFHAGAAKKTFELLHQYDLVRQLFAGLPRVLARKQEHVLSMILRGFQETDHRLHQGKTIAIPFLFAFLLWGGMVARQQELINQDTTPIQAFTLASREILQEQNHLTSIPKRFQHVVQEIWYLQLYLEQRRSRRIKSVLDRPRFRAAFDLFALRAQAGEPLGEIVEWWTRIQSVNEKEEDAMIKALGNK